MPVTPTHVALIFHTRGTTVLGMLLCNSRLPNHDNITYGYCGESASSTKY